MEFIDEHPVVSHRVRFKNRAMITEDQAALVKDDNVVIWLVRTRCLPPQYHPVSRESDERYRFNIQNVEAAVPLDGDMRDGALAFMDHGAAQGYMTGERPRFVEDALFDPHEYGPQTADYQLARLAEYLHDIGELRENETAVDAVRRLLRTPEPPALQAPAPEFPDPGVPIMNLPENDDAIGDVEVVGSIYGPGHTGKTQALLDEVFAHRE